MFIRVLGDVALLGADGRTVALPGSRQPALLASLVSRAGEVVSADRLVDLLWPDGTPPVNPTAALYSAVFKLRASLAGVSGREVLTTRDRGYLLDLRPGDVDADVFASLVRESRDQEPSEAAATLARALELWRGTPYAGFADTDIAHLDAVHLQELRFTAVERYGAVLLAAGRPEDAVSVLQPFVAEQPLRETARSTLMQALHAVGRTTDALDHYHSYREHLADELGLEPSPALREVQSALLRTAPTGAASPHPAIVAATRAAAPVPPAAVQAAAVQTAVQTGLPGMAVRYLRTEAGNVLAYGSVGTGPKVVVLLGWVSSLDVIASGRDPRSSVLERLTGELRLTLYDRAGTGLSPGPVKDYGLEASVAELAEIVRAVGPPVSLLSMSSSGPIAVTLAHRRPEWVDSLVLFGTFANGPAVFTHTRLKEMVVEIARTAWGLGSKMLADLYRPGLSDEAAWHLAKVFRDSASPDVAAAYLESMYDQDVSPLLGDIAVPTLVLHYRSDRLIPFRGGQELAAGLPKATLIPLDGRVHLPDANDLDAIQQAVVSHVSEHARG